MFRDCDYPGAQSEIKVSSTTNVKPQGQKNARGSKQTSHPWINQQIIQSSNRGGVQNLLRTIQTFLPQMNLVNLSTSLHRLAKMTANDQKVQSNLRRNSVLCELINNVSATLASANAQEAPQTQSLSNVAWSMATLRLANRPLVKTLADLAIAQIHSFKPYELSTMLWAFAKLSTVEGVGNCAESLFQVASGFIKRRVAEFEFRCLAMIVWAFGTLKHRNPGVFHSIATQMVPKMDSANCQEMANTAWAFGTVDISEERLFTELGNRSAACLDDFKPQELSNILWGFASNRCFHEALFAKAAQVARDMEWRNELQAQHLANLLWAFARVHARHSLTQDVMLFLLPSCTRQIATFKPQELSSTCQAVAKTFGQCNLVLDSGDRKRKSSVDESVLRYNQPQPEVLHFLLAVLPCALPNLHNFSEQSLANIAFAFSSIQVGGNDGMLFAAVDREVVSRTQKKKLNAGDLVRLIKGLGGVPHNYCSNALSVLFGSVACHVDKLQQQELLHLSRVCAFQLGLRRGHDHLSRDEVRRCCHRLAGFGGVAGVGQTAYPPVNGGLAPGAWIAFPGTVPAATYSGVEYAEPPMLWVLPVGSPSSQQREDVTAGGEWVSRDEEEEVASVRSCGTEKSFGKSASENVQWVCSVKNSFLHVACADSNSIAGESTDVDDGEKSSDGSQCSGLSRPRNLMRSASAPNLLEMH